jgi:RNA-splicing ligase RtcB
LQEIKRNTNIIPKDLAYIEGKDLDLYLMDMQKCQNYAYKNRVKIAEIIVEKAKLNFSGYFHTVHNYIDIPNKIIRKGAIAANKGEKVIIPMNMRDGSLICIGKGNEDWLCSAPHGAGRIMSRNQASEQITMEDFKNSMDGIYTTSVNENTIDEAPMAYKSAKIIQEDIKDTVEIVKVIKPIYNFKAN